MTTYFTYPSPLCNTWIILMVSELFVVATPIGNLADISQRALQVLEKVDVILAEDTRHSRGLMRHHGVSTRLTALHAYNEHDQVRQILAKLEAGVSMALVSDAGTPLISDPGFPLVKAARERGIKITVIPGPCAAIAALSIAGLSCDHFVFEGFLPVKNGPRLARLEALRYETRTLVFYEAPHRIVSLMESMAGIWGDEHYVVVVKELTKAFETVHSGPIKEQLSWFAEDPKRLKGEFVVLTQGVEKEAGQEHDKTLRVLLDHVSVKEAASIMAQLTNEGKNTWYQRALSCK